MSTSVYVLTHEYSDKSGYQICGATENYVVAMAWHRGGSENHVYHVTLDHILDIAPASEGWPQWEGGR